MYDDHKKRQVGHGRLGSLEPGKVLVMEDCCCLASRVWTASAGNSKRLAALLCSANASLTSHRSEATLVSMMIIFTYPAFFVFNLTSCGDILTFD